MYNPEINHNPSISYAHVVVAVMHYIENVKKFASAMCYFTFYLQ